MAMKFPPGTVNEVIREWLHIIESEVEAENTQKTWYMKWRREWNSFEVCIGKKDISVSLGFERRNIIEDNKKRSEDILLEYMFYVHGG